MTTPTPQPTQPSPDGQRRRLATAAVAAPLGLIALGSAGCQKGPSMDRQLSFTTLDEPLAELTRLSQATRLQPHTPWNWGQTQTQLAQSIEYSMSGFTEAMSALFQRTVGAAAFGVFAWRGRMSHPLDDPIPGAPALPTDTAAALSRLQPAVQAFRDHAGPLQPHLAYGALSKTEYEQAHATHLASHFSAFSASM